jgi:glycogen operon protein
MLCGGDEFARTQKGNNNAYCQDNEISWFSWERNAEENQLLEFTRHLIHLRKKHPVFRRPKFFQGRRIRGSEIKDVMWFNPGGNEMSDEEWASPFVRCLGMLLSGDTIDVLDFEGQAIRDDTFLLLINAHFEAIPFVLPGQEHIDWQLIFDTSEEAGFLHEPRKCPSGDDLEVKDRSAVLLKLVGGSQAQARKESWKKRAVEIPREAKTPPPAKKKKGGTAGA